MNASKLAALAVVPLTFAAACGSVDGNLTSGTTSGSGGAGGSTVATTTSVTTSVTTSAGTGGAPVDNGMPSDVYPAPHSAPPSVESYGGPTIAMPKIVPVYFADYEADILSQVQDFESKVGASQYWAANTAEYGVAPATALPPVVLTEMAPTTIDDTGIQMWLGAKLNGNDPAFPPADYNTLYVLHYPETTTITLQGSTSCQTFGGYHSDFTLDSAHNTQDVAYAVVPGCANFDGMTLLDATTASESHELLEAATDPYPMSNPAFADIDLKHYYWARILGGGEIGDMCAQFSDSYTTYPDLPYLVQRSWSDKAAQAGKDPCVPELPGEVYFNSAPLLKDNITTTVQGQSLTYKGVKIPVGMSATVEVDLFSEGATSGPWTVTAKDLSGGFNGGTPNLMFSWDRTSGVNGEKLHLTITVMTAGKHGTETFAIDSTLGNDKHVWLGIVGSN